MKRNLNLWQFFGFLFVSLFGTLLHFIYDWFGGNIAALFSGVNESTWEHMKILFFPLFLFAIIESFVFGKKYDNFWCVKLKGTLLGLLLIPIIFYTIHGIFGKTPDFINISIFYISAAAVFIYETRQFKSKTSCKSEKIAILIFGLIAISFMIFTFSPPEIPLFKDPINNSYGI